MIEKERASQPMVVVDAGNLFWKSAKLPESDRSQRLIKADLIAHAYQLSGIDAMVPGPGDLSIGVDSYRQLVERYSLPIVASNLNCSGFEVPGSRTIERAGRTIGIVGVVDDGVQGCEVAEPVAAVREAVNALGPVDLVLLLSSADTDTDQEIAREVSRIDFIVAGGGGGLHNPQPRALDSGAFALASGNRGKKLGVLELEWVDGGKGWENVSEGDPTAERLTEFRGRLQDAERDLAAAKDDAGKARVQRRIEYYNQEIKRLEDEAARSTAVEAGTHNSFSHRLVELNAAVGEHAATQELVQKAKAEIESTSATPLPSAPPATGPLAGAEACRACHLEEYAQWKGTPHATAYNSLEASKRQLDNDCYACHVTGAMLPGGPQTAAEVPATLRNVGCEACHGVGGEHARDAKVVKMGAAVPLETCTQCHDGARDEGRFDAKTYLPKVQHGAAHGAESAH